MSPKNAFWINIFISASPSKPVHNHQHIHTIVYLCENGNGKVCYKSKWKMKRKIFINLILIRPWLCKSLSFSFEIFHLLLQIFFPLISRTQRAISVIVNRRPPLLEWGLGWNAEEQFVVSSIASERKCLCYANYKDIWKVNRMNFIPTVRDRLRHVFRIILPQITSGDERYGAGAGKSKLCTYLSVSHLQVPLEEISQKSSPEYKDILIFIWIYFPT